MYVDTYIHIHAYTYTYAYVHVYVCVRIHIRRASNSAAVAGVQRAPSAGGVNVTRGSQANIKH